MKKQEQEKPHNLRSLLHEIIFEADTPAGKNFDVALLVLIVFSVLVVLLESVDTYADHYGDVFLIIEWVLTILFTVEYLLRMYSVHKPLKYASSFYGVVDLLSILPTYLSVIFTGAQYFAVIRALRLMRVFRIFKLGHFLKEGYVLVKALKASRTKISIFLLFILVMVTIIGSIMYLIEGGANPAFDSIPRSIYWAIVTLTTVGYGDISPQTTLGQFFSAIVMILGYAVIAVPTGIVSAELVNPTQTPMNTQSCPSCSAEGHEDDADYCKYCGSKL